MPAPGRTGIEQGFGNWQWSSQADRGQQQMVVSQPQPFCKPSQILGEAVGAVGQMTILLSRCQVVPLHETGVDPLTHRRLSQGRHRRRLAKHDGGVPGGKVPDGGATCPPLDLSPTFYFLPSASPVIRVLPYA